MNHLLKLDYGLKNSTNFRFFRPQMITINCTFSFITLFFLLKINRQYFIRTQILKTMRNAC